MLVFAVDCSVHGQLIRQFCFEAASVQNAMENRLNGIVNSGQLGFVI